TRMMVEYGAVAALPLLSALGNSYQFGGVTVNGQDDAMLSTALMSELLHLGRADLHVLTTSANDQSSAVDVVTDQLDGLQTYYECAEGDLSAVTASITRIQAALPEHPTAADRQRIEREAAPFVRQQTQLSSATTAYETFFKTLFDQTGAVAPALIGVV